MTADVLARFSGRIAPQEDGCWIWTGAPSGPDARNGLGYGLFGFGGRRVWAHRFSYEAFVGPIPEGLQIDHLCNVRMCVNPAHLEPVTQAENLRRGAERKTRCKNGHEFTPDNIYVDGRGRRECLTCARVRWQKGSERKKRLRAEARA